MHAKEQDMRIMDRKIELWFTRHFHHVPPGSQLHVDLLAAKDDVKRVFGIDTTRFQKGESA